MDAFAAAQPRLGRPCLFARQVQVLDDKLAERLRWHIRPESGTSLATIATVLEDETGRRPSEGSLYLHRHGKCLTCRDRGFDGRPV